MTVSNHGEISNIKKDYAMLTSLLGCLKSYKARRGRATQLHGGVIVVSDV